MADTVRQAISSPGHFGYPDEPIVRGLLLQGDHADTPFPSNPWGVPIDANLAQALTRIWAPIAEFAPRFVATLRTRTLGLALVNDDAGVPFLSYLIWRWNNWGCEQNGEHLGLDLVGEGCDARLDLVSGWPPRWVVERHKVVPALAGPVPQPVRDFWAVHHRMESPSGSIGGDVDRTLPEYLGNHWSEAVRQSLGGHPADRLVEGVGSFHNHSCLLDLDRLDATGSQTVADWSPEDRKVTNRGRFWEWLDWPACDLFFDGWIRDSTSARQG